jgi:hypothetical protein
MDGWSKLKKPHLRTENGLLGPFSSFDKQLKDSPPKTARSKKEIKILDRQDLASSIISSVHLQ